MRDTLANTEPSKETSEAPSVVLASASGTRAEILRKAGVPFTVEPAAVDEAEMKRSLAAEGATPAEAALALAELKARKAAARHPGALVIGADQILECNGVWFDKPPDLDHAQAQLRSLRGHTHRLVSGVCVVRDGERVWDETDTAELVMRQFSDAFLDAYLQKVGDAVCGWVGGYQVEGLGAQLFSRVRGDHYTILGLPLIPLLAFLREHGVVAA